MSLSPHQEADLCRSYRTGETAKRGQFTLVAQVLLLVRAAREEGTASKPYTIGHNG